MGKVLIPALFCGKMNKDGFIADVLQGKINLEEYSCDLITETEKYYNCIINVETKGVLAVRTNKNNIFPFLVNIKQIDSLYEKNGTIELKVYDGKFVFYKKTDQDTDLMCEFKKQLDMIKDVEWTSRVNEVLGRNVVNTTIQGAAYADTTICFSTEYNLAFASSYTVDSTTLPYTTQIFGHF